MRKVLFLLGLAASSLALIVTPGGAASDTPCVGVLTGVHDNVVVPEGQNCFLAGAVILGNLFVRPQASLSDSFQTPNNVVGNLFAERARFVQLENTRVAGDADLKRTDAFLTGISFQGQLVRFRVDGDLLVEEAATVSLDVASVGGDLDVVRAGSTRVSTVFVRRIPVGQNLNVRDSIAREIYVGLNDVGGGIQVQNNVTTSTGFIVEENDVVGNVEVTNNVVSGSIGWFIRRNAVGRNFNLENNVVNATNPSFPGTSWPVTLNEVGENMAVIKNLGPSAKAITANTVADTLRCFDNDPPFVGGPNTAPKKEGQCF